MRAGRYTVFGMYLGQILVICLFLVACDDLGLNRGAPEKGTFLIQVGETGATTADFYQILEIAKAAYPDHALKDKGALNALKMRVFNQLKEELLILERARELNIRLSEPEVQDAINQVKQDYPDDLFEKELLEQAISWQAWEARLRVRLLMEKVVAQELEQGIVITAADIAKFSKGFAKYRWVCATDTDDEKETDRFVLQFLRTQKVQEMYLPWIEALQKKYKILINQEKWEAIIK